MNDRRDRLVRVIFGITDSRNSPAPVGLAPVCVGLLVLLIGATFGFNSGYAINPARDFGPRLLTFVAGWGGEVLRAGHAWWWVPIVAPCVGGAVGGWAYDASRDRRPGRVSTGISLALQLSDEAPDRGAPRGVAGQLAVFALAAGVDGREDRRGDAGRSA